MARFGLFDTSLRQAALFDAALLPEGWFSDDLIGAPADTATATATAGAVGAQGAFAPLGGW